MLRVQLTRSASTDSGTPGVIAWRGGAVLSLELPWRDNKPGISSILPGRYLAFFMPISASGKFRDVYHLQNVPGRQGILIHAGNFAGDTTLSLHTDSFGCILPGLRTGKINGQEALLSSRDAMRKLHAATGRKTFELEIVNRD